MRNMSFALTTDQVRQRTKTVTRRVGWLGLKPGTLLQPVVKAQGLKKGERVEKIGGPVRVVSVTREPLFWIKTPNYGAEELRREGGRWATGGRFVEMFMKANGLSDEWAEVTRIQFEYLDEGAR
jgi:hypothetical protein